MKHNLFRNPGLKIASLAIAFVVWLIILNVSNPITARTITGVPVNVTNSAYIESMNQSYRIADGYDTVSVTVQGYRSAVEQLTQSSITVTADLTQIIDMDSDPVMVPLSVSVSGISRENVSVTPSNIRIVLEDMESKEFVITPVTGSSTPASGYEVGKMTVSPNRITIKGPASVIDRINDNRVEAEVDVTGMSESASLTPTLHIYDKNGDELSDTSMSYLSYNLEDSDISVDVQLYEVVTDVTIEAETYGEPAAGYHVGEVTVTPSTISLAGSESAIAALQEADNKVVISADTQAVDVTGATEDLDIPLSLSDYLPDELEVQSGQSASIVVSVKILQYDTASVELDTRAIERKNLAEGYTAVFSDASIDVRVRGADETISQLRAADIGASVDFSGMTDEGEQEVRVDIALPSGCTLVDDVMTEVTITKTVTQESGNTAAEQAAS